MSVVRPIAVLSLLGLFAGGALPGCGQKGPLVQPDAAPKHRRIGTPKATPKATPQASPNAPASPAGNAPTDAPPPSPPASPAPNDPQQ